MTEKLRGIFIPAVTPFDEEEHVSLEMLADNYSKWNGTDVAGYMCLGSNGEFRSLDDDESMEVITAVSELAAPEKTIIVGIGRESLYQTLKFMDRVLLADIRADYLSALVPSYFAKRMTDESIIEYYTSLADHSTIPVMMYCAPAFTNGVTISAEAVKILADHPNIAGIKDTSKDMMDAYMDAAGGREDFSVCAGSLSNLMKCYARGGQAGVVSAANYLPQQCAEIDKAFRAEGLTAAGEVHAAVAALSKATGARASVAGVKATMNLCGFSGGKPRRPVAAVSKAEVEEYKAALREAGVIS